MIDLDVLYRILAEVARNNGQISYGELSVRYQQFTNEWYEPHGTWDGPLGELNVRLNEQNRPPLSGVVVLQDSREPGDGFWGSSPNVPERPANADARMIRYSEILASVHAASWPDEMPV